MTEQADLRQELDAARATIAAQAMQIHRLLAEAERDSGVDVLRDILELADVVGSTVGQAPYQALLHGIVHAARRLFDAGAASIALLDHAENELVFEAATGGEVIGMRFPAHQGIAGWVMMTGEPIAVSDVRRDPRFAKDFAQSTGYVPQSILAVPLLVDEDVEGVLEVLDKHNATSFGLDDMELLGLFARPAAVAVEQARMVGGVGRLLVSELERLAGERGNSALERAARTAYTEGTTNIESTLELARLVQRVSRKGDRARQLATDLLEGVVRYLG